MEASELVPGKMYVYFGTEYWYHGPDCSGTLLMYLREYIGDDLLTGGLLVHEFLWPNGRLECYVDEMIPDCFSEIP